MKTKTLFLTRCLLATSILGCALSAFPVSAFAEEVSWLRTAADGPSPWNEDANWVTVDGDNFAPAANFDDTPVIANGGTAFLDEPAGFNQEPFNMVIVGRDNQAGGLEIRPGGELKTDALTVAGAPTSSLSLSGDGTLTVSGNASTTRVTRVSGPNVDFSVSGSYTVGGSFQPVITGATHSAVTVGGAANIGGTLRPEFSGVAPRLGDSWRLINAASVAGSFNVDASLAPPLDPGIIYASSVNTTAGDVSLAVTNTLDLLVNRRTGAASIRNVVGNPLQLDRYTISSASGRLDPSAGAWLSLADSGSAGTGWTEGPSNAQSITESKSGPPASIAVGSPVGIGAPVVPANFAEEDLVFGFSAGGVSLTGLVTYEGLPLNLVLNVDPATGNTVITNQATIPIEFDGYAVLSPSGALQTANGMWNSLQDSGAGGAGWQEANPTRNALAELNPAGSTTLAPSQSLDLGPAFNVSGAQDLSFSYFLAGGTPDLREGYVAYGIQADPLDCNGDGVVDMGDLSCMCGADTKDAVLAQLGLLEGDLDGNGSVAFPDFLVLSANFSQAVSGYDQGDIDCNGAVEFADFLVLSSNFGQSAPAGAAAAVPEPAGLALLGIGGLMLARLRPRRSSRCQHVDG